MLQGFIQDFLLGGGGGGNILVIFKTFPGVRQDCLNSNHDL